MADFDLHYSDPQVEIYRGDARQVMHHLGQFDLVVADPPYAFGGKRKEWQITASVAIGLADAARHVKKGGAMLVMTAASGRGIEYVQGAIGPILPFNRLLVWCKRFVNSPVAGPWRWDIVPVLAFGKCSFGRPGYSSWYESDGHARLLTDHPAELPSGIGTWLVEPFAEAKTVLDPFCGSGVFLAAAKIAGKTAVGIDIEKRWCEAAAARLLQGTLALETAS